MRYFVFQTAADAQAAVGEIDLRARAIFAAQGYTITEGGAIVGKCDGADNPDGITTTWDIPRQRLDGKWVVAHPEAHPSASFETGAGAVVEIVTAGIVATTEDENASWWALAEPGV